MSRNQQFFAAAFSLAFVAGAARAQSEATSLDELSALPIATFAPALPSAQGGEFLVTSSDVGPYATAYTLERLCDGTRVRVEIGTRGVRLASLANGSVVTAKVLDTGVLLAAGSVSVGFVPNALGRALLAV